MIMNRMRSPSTKTGGRVPLSRRQVLASGAAGLGAATLGLPRLASAQDNTLVFAVNSITGNFEPTVWNGFGDTVITMDSLGRGLTHVTFQSTEVQGAVAESWEVSEDGRVYTFAIRPGMTFHDGTDVTAQDVFRTFNRILDPEDPTRPAGTGAIDNLGGDNLQEIELVDDMTFRFILRDPDAAFAARLSRPDMVIISGAALDEYGSDIGPNLVSCGPYRLVDATPGERAVVEAFDGFYLGRPSVDRVVFQVLPDPLALTSALVGGTVSMSNFVPHSNLEQLASSGRVTVHEPQAYISLFLTMNATAGPLSDMRVRQAINYAVDRDAVINEAFFGYAYQPAYMCTAAQMGYDPAQEAYSTRDLDRARQLIQEAGAEGATIMMHSQNQLFWPSLGQVVQRNLEDIGLNIDTQYVESGSFFGIMFDKTQHELGLWQRSAFMPDPDGKFSPLFFSGTLSAEDTTAHTGLPTQPELERRILEALQAQDPEVRNQLYIDLNRFLAEEVMVHAMLANIYTPVASQNDLSGVNADGMGTYRTFLETVSYL